MEVMALRLGPWTKNFEVPLSDLRKEGLTLTRHL